MAFRDVSGALVKGVAAGAVGTGVMTGYQMAQTKLQGGAPSTTPADAVEKTFPVSTSGKQEKMRLASLTHWGYGTAWGAVRGLLGATGMSGTAASTVFFGLVWGSALTMLPALDLAPKPQEWGPKALGEDALMHGIYATAVGLAYEAMS
ncbi:MAG: hypothetical protein H0V77_09925 [Actinobacteria bacterium]|nr:hypothetical protein [Actinomycetota bacterium]